MDQVSQAAALARMMHRGQKYGGVDYFTGHVSRVVTGLYSSDGITYVTIAIAFLHDVVEDTQATVSDLDELGFEPDIVDGVIAITKQDGETYADYIERVGQHPEARKVKIADLRCHLAHTDTLSDSMRERYEKALSRLLDLLKS